MKNPRSACLLCRHPITAHGSARISQWQPQISQFSTATASKDIDLVRLALRPNTSQRDILWFRKPKRGTWRKTLRQKTEFVPSNPKKNPLKSPTQVDTLFQQIVREQTPGDGASIAGQSKKEVVRLALFKAVKQLGELDHMLDKGEPLMKAYNYFETTICPIIPQLRARVPEACRATVIKLSDMLYDAKLAAIRSPELPSISSLFLNISTVTGVRTRWWHKLVGALVQEIVNIDPAAKSSDSSAVDDGLITQDAMIADLIECWKILSLPSVEHVKALDEVLDGFWFPRMDKYSLRTDSCRKNFPQAFTRGFPHIPPAELGQPTTVLAIATYALLFDPRRTDVELKRRATRLISRVAYLITYVQYENNALRSHTRNAFPGLENFVMAEWTKIKKDLKKRAKNLNFSVANEFSKEPSPLDQTAIPGDQEIAPDSQATPPHNQTDINESSLLGRLHLAITARNLSEVDWRWRKFVGPPAQTIPPKKAEELRQYPKVFDTFIYAYMALNQPGKALLALYTLRSVGCRPTLRTWNGMLEGCKKARNLNGIRNVWAKLVLSGMKLDMKLWTTRVSGLVKCGQFTYAINALSEMMRLWDASSKDDNAKAVKPTMEPVNAILAALISQNKVEDAEWLLGWADKKGFKLDIFTFNPLLRRYIQDGRVEDVRRIFATMKERGVDADAATFTILVEAAFLRIPPGDHEAEAKTVADVLDGMEQAGLEANLQNYGKIIYHMLQGGEVAKDAVKHVLSHLWNRGLELTPHIYTMIVDHYFSREPPDIASVDSLLRRRSLLDYDNLDAIFYDRVIFGYAQAALPERALRYYHKLTGAGVTVKLNTQAMLLNGLLQQDFEKEAKVLIESTRKFYEQEHSIGGTEHTGIWNHSFWHIAAAHGLLELDTLPNRKAPL